MINICLIIEYMYVFVYINYMKLYVRLRKIIKNQIQMRKVKIDKNSYNFGKKERKILFFMLSLLIYFLKML